jgi:hypothetical protein
MVLFAHHVRLGTQLGIGIIGAVSQREDRRVPSSDTNFPVWKSRFARSSGYIPERDGPMAPPLSHQETRKSTRAPSEDVISDPAAAGAAC